MSGYEDEDRYYCGSDGSAGADDDTFLERSDRQSREEGAAATQHLSMSRYNDEDEDFAPAR